MMHLAVFAFVTGAILFGLGIFLNLGRLRAGVYRKKDWSMAVLIAGGLLFIIGISLPAFAAGPSFWTNPHVICGQNCVERLEGGFSLSLNEKVGLYGFAQNISGRGMQPFQQAYAGPSLRSGGFEAGVGIGADNASNVIKNGWVAYNTDATSLFATAERGGLPYNKLTATHRLGDFHLGTMYDTPFGWGARVEYDANKTIRPWVGIFQHDVALGVQMDF